jgi:hypothetical protein
VAVATCSELSAALGEPLHATAPFAPTWLLIEEPAAWGRRAVAEAGFGELERRGKEHGVRVGLVRRRYGRPRGDDRRSVFVARCAEPSLERLVDPDLDLDALDPAHLPRGERIDRPLYLVCTNGRRDACCARAGTAVARALETRLRDRLWETTHVGGHRFAANLVALPHGLVFGRLDPASAAIVVAAYESGRIELAHFRGRTTLTAEQQAVEHFVRERDALDRAAEDLAARSRIRVEDVRLEPPRLTSCGGEPERPRAWRVREA